MHCGLRTCCEEAAAPLAEPALLQIAAPARPQGLPQPLVPWSVQHLPCTELLPVQAFRLRLSRRQVGFPFLSLEGRKRKQLRRLGLPPESHTYSLLGM